LEVKTMLIRTDPFQVFDRLAEQLSGTGGTWSRPAVVVSEPVRALSSGRTRLPRSSTGAGE
jgi:hypothetical protein